jgi:hypothetical protein
MGNNAPGISVGSLVGPYTIAALIGTGGMGKVFCARDGQLKLRVEGSAS